MPQFISLQTDLNDLFDKIREDTLFVLRQQNMMVQLVTSRSARGYAARQVPIFSQAVAMEVGDGDDFAGHRKLTKTNSQTITPTEAMAGYILSNRMMLTETDNNISVSAGMEIGGALAEKVDKDIIGKFSGFTHSLGSAGATLSIDTSSKAVALLHNSKAAGTIWAVVHPFMWRAVWFELGQPAADMAFLGDVANQALRDYFVGRFLAVAWLTSSNITLDASDDGIAGFFARSALIYDEREPMSVMPEFDASRRAVELNGHIGYGVGYMRPEHGVGVTADAATPS